MLQASVRSSKSESNEPFTRQGSLRRVLPSEHNRENIFGRQNEDINMFYKDIRQEYIIFAEYKMVISENVQGIYVIPSKENPFVWFGVIFVRSGIYDDGIFRFNIILPESFPDGGHPKVVFQSIIIHPVINSETNELNLSSGFPIWIKGEQHIWQVVKYIYWIFHYCEFSLAHAINEEARNMFNNDIDEFKSKVQNCVKLSHHHLYDPPPTNDIYYITFEKYNSEVHGPIRAKINAGSNESGPNIVGHSWVTPGSLKPLSRSNSCIFENDD